MWRMSKNIKVIDKKNVELIKNILLKNWFIQKITRILWKTENFKNRRNLKWYGWLNKILEFYLGLIYKVKGWDKRLIKEYIMHKHIKKSK